jgi:1-acyl-sn-glycerol-3-phosphate acyltransferase
MNKNITTSSELVKTGKTVYHLTNNLIVKPVFHLYFRGKVTGKEKVPLEGKLIIVSNHASVFDPPLISAAIPRPVSYMAKQELFEVNGLSQLITSLGAYPVNRAGFDRRAIRQAISRLEEGWATGIFLEGTRTQDAKVHEPKLGAALIAAKAQAPLLPVCLCGTEKILTTDSKFPQCITIQIKIGDLIPPPTSNKKEDLEATSQICADAINQLHDFE